MNRRNIFSNLTIFSHISSSVVTYKEVVSIYLAWLGALTCERRLTWHHVSLEDWVVSQQTTRLEDASSYDACPTVTPSGVAWLNCDCQIGTTSSYLKLAPTSFSSLSLFLSLAHGRPSSPPTSPTPSAFLRRLRPSNFGPQPLPTRADFLLFSLSFFLSRTGDRRHVDFIDTDDLPPSPLVLELRSSTSPKVMDHF
jgi:hypothetical protein